uniref:Olduvai domain-containing protein n=1 Tax=Theropithecus gelada TaxID=9565 RepID=A0A8D2ET71_THEGE
LELSDSCQPYRSAFYSLEKQHVGLVLGGDRIKKDQEEEEDQGPHAPGNSDRELLEGEDPEVLQCSLDICYSTPSSYLELPDSCQPYKSAFYSLEEQHVGLALYVINIEKNQEEEEDQDPPCPRLSPELPEVEEQDVPQDSLDEVYLTPSLPPDLSDCQQPYSSTLCSLENQLACSALDVACEYSSPKVTKLYYSPRQPLYILFPVTCAGEMDHRCRQPL